MLEHIIIPKTLILAVGIVMLAGAGKPALADYDDSGGYTDRIHLKNGDVITGNMKELDRGKLRFKTRTMDTVFINWVDIESIDSDKYLRIERVDGTFNYGVIKQSDLNAGKLLEEQRQHAERTLPKKEYEYIWLAKPKGEVYGLTPARCWKVTRRG